MDQSADLVSDAIESLGGIIISSTCDLEPVSDLKGKDEPDVIRILVGLSSIHRSLDRGIGNIVEGSLVRAKSGRLALYCDLSDPSKCEQTMLDDVDAKRYVNTGQQPKPIDDLVSLGVVLAELIVPNAGRPSVDKDYRQNLSKKLGRSAIHKLATALLRIDKDQIDTVDDFLTTYSSAWRLKEGKFFEPAKMLYLILRCRKIQLWSLALGAVCFAISFLLFILPAWTVQSKLRREITNLQDQIKTQNEQIKTQNDEVLELKSKNAVVRPSNASAMQRAEQKWWSFVEDETAGEDDISQRINGEKDEEVAKILQGWWREVGEEKEYVVTVNHISRVPKGYENYSFQVSVDRNLSAAGKADSERKLQIDKPREIRLKWKRGKTISTKVSHGSYTWPGWVNYKSKIWTGPLALYRFSIQPWKEEDDFRIVFDEVPNLPGPPTPSHRVLSREVVTSTAVSQGGSNSKDVSPKDLIPKF